jgi:hypothetical protein
LLPTLLSERDFVLFFRHQLRLIDVDLRPRKEHVRHYASREKLLHLNVEAHRSNVGDRRMRMRLLNDLEAIQRENPANQLQVRMFESHMVALKLLVHRRLGSLSDDVIEEE